VVRSLKKCNNLDDIPSGLVSLASLGRLAGIPTPACRAIIDLGSILLDRDYWAKGRTVKRLGLEGMTIEEIREFVRTGTKASTLGITHIRA
jgi:opine dehydrogenase